MKRIAFTELAEGDLDDIWIGIALDNEAAADRLIDGIETSLRKLLESPFMGRTADFLRKGARVLVHRDYLLVYRPTEYGIAVLRVAHGARSMELLDIPIVPDDRCEEPLLTAYDVLADVKPRMGNSRLKISATNRADLA